jgi:hypothetical protein
MSASSRSDEERAEPTPETLHAVARFYAGLGLHVLPVKSRSKHPALADWPRLATKDPSTVDEWWSGGYAGCGIGVATGEASNLVVVDVDVRSGRPADDLVADLRDRYGLGDTPTVLTPSGGLHLYVAWPGFNPAHDALGKSIDVQGEGRFVVAPPSIHPNGGVYRWEHSLRPSLVPIVALPSMFEPATAETVGGDVDPRFAEVLTAGGFTFGRSDAEGRHHWTRPGKDRREGTGVTVYPFPDSHAICWSTSVPELDVRRPYGVVELAEALSVHVAGTTWQAAFDERIEASTSSSVRPLTERGSWGRLMTVAELLGSTEPEHDWLVPGFLERGDRLIVTGPDGHGKSTLLRQLGMGAALGEQTLSTSLLWTSHPPCVVLLVDLENSPLQLRREFGALLGPLGGDVDDALCRFHLVSRPDGLSLDDPKDREGDRASVEELVVASGGELLILGPIYKALSGDPTEEMPTRDVARWIDRLRVRYGLTVLLEAHTPHAANRPYGWSGWKRWPEFGFHLHQDGRLEHFRGQREDRAWPEKLTSRRGRESGSQRWPWVPDLGNHVEPRFDPVERGIEAARPAVLRFLREARGPLTANQLVELCGRRKANVLAVIARMHDAGEVTSVRVERLRENGRPYSTEGFRLAPSSGEVNPVPEYDDARRDLNRELH